MNWFSSLSYKQKNRWLVLAAGLFLLLAYGLSIHQTVGLYQENKLLRRQRIKAKHAPRQIQHLQSELRTLKTGMQESPLNFQEELLEQVSKTAKKYRLHLRAMKEIDRFSNEQFQVQTQQITLQGKYKLIVQGIREMEKQLQTGQVVATKFQTEKDRISKKTELIAYIYVQNIKNHE